MTEDRKNLLAFMWKGLFLTCRCGKCPCVAMPPAASASWQFDHWARQAAEVAEDEARICASRREAVQEQLDRDKRRRPKNRLFATGPALFHLELLRMADENERFARRFRRRAKLYRQLARGLPPFAPEPKEGDS